MSIQEEFRKGVLDYYRSQQGKGFPVYRGADLQYGRGFGDVLKSVAKYALPVIAPVALRLIADTAIGLKSGKSFKDSIKGAIKPSIGEAMTVAGDKLKDEPKPQSGIGRRRKYRRKVRKRKKVKRVLPISHQLVYKGRGRKRKSKSKSPRIARKRFLPTNF